MDRDDEAEHYKSVYAEYGLAMYLAQCLEHGIVNALMYTDLIPKSAGKSSSAEEWRALFDSYMDERFSLTLGRLVGELNRIVLVSPELSELLKAALGLRNFLAHAFFRERAELFLSAPGREKMIAELVAAQELLQQAESVLAETVRPAQLRIGLTADKLAAYRQQWTRANGLEL